MPRQKKCHTSGLLPQKKEYQNGVIDGYIFSPSPCFPPDSWQWREHEDPITPVCPGRKSNPIVYQGARYVMASFSTVLVSKNTSLRYTGPLINLGSQAVASENCLPHGIRRVRLVIFRECVTCSKTVHKSHRHAPCQPACTLGRDC